MKILCHLTLLCTFTATVLAQSKVGFEPGDTTAIVLKRQAGQRVEVRMKSGEKLAGKVEAVGEKSVHLSALTGQEFFDAVIVLDDISVVIVRTGGK